MKDFAFSDPDPEAEYRERLRQEQAARAAKRAKEDEDQEDDVRRARRQSKGVSRKAIQGYTYIMMIALAVAAFVFIPINAAHNFQFFEMIVGKVEEGGGWHTLYVAMAIALVVIGAGFWLMLSDTRESVKLWCLSAAIIVGLMSHLASYLSLDGQTVAAIHQENNNSNQAKIAMMGVEAMTAQLKAAAANSEAAATAVEKLTSRYGEWDAASVGEINRNQLPGLTNAQSAAGGDMRLASTALERAMQMASEVGGAGESPINTTFKDLGDRLGWSAEKTRVITNISFSGVISWAPLILTLVMGAIGFNGGGPAPATQGAGEATGKKPEPTPAPAQRSRVMPAAAKEQRDTIRGPVISDPIEVEDEPKREPLFAPRKPSPEPKIQTTEQAPERKKSAKDRAPGNKRSAKFSQQLAALNAAIGSTFPIGQRMNVEDMKRMVNCNSETATRLRNALAESGVAHWQGRSLFAGKAPE